jgi:ferredoxin
LHLSGTSPSALVSLRVVASLPAGVISRPRVLVRMSGEVVTFKVGAEYLLELAEACDVPVKWSCRTGVCHSCESGLISGEVAYQPDPLDPPAPGNLLICCARPTGDVVIDL